MATVRRSGPSNLDIEADPTKEFFIDMLVRDIELIPAIVDLVDNSVDGARRTKGNRSFRGLWVRLEISDGMLRIADNCGGISIEIARKYAFRFGRPEQMGREKRSIGQFGVGMKRAIFKLGNEFSIASRTTTEQWTMHEDVSEWRKRQKWRFRFSSIERKRIPAAQTGTTLEVSRLHGSVAQEFELESFKSQLEEEIRRSHQESMDKGLAITLEGVPLTVQPIRLLQSSELRPAVDALSFNDTATPVNVKLFVGIATSEPQAAGWYVYCNGRMVVGPDQSSMTGWGTSVGSRIPRFHNQYGRFRGYVFFDSDDASRLPWTTTKTGLDANSETYRRTRLKMVLMMRPVIDFLNLVDRDRELASAEETHVAQLEEAVEAANLVGIEELEENPKFVAPSRPQPRRVVPRTMQSIQYTRPKDKIDRVKKALKVNSATRVGEGTFDYFYARECEE